MDSLTRLAEYLEPKRENDPIVYDLFNAARFWRDLGERLLENKGAHLLGRVEQEVELFAALQAHYGARLQQNPEYAQVMEAGSHVIAAGKAYKPPPDGYLGSVRIVRETFAFLTSEFGLAPGDDLDTMWDYASPAIRVSLSLPNHYSSWCDLSRPSDNNPDKYSLEDLLFMGGKSVSLALPPDQEIETEADVQAWFTTVAAVLREYGADVLAGRPGAFERLAAAAAERQRLYIEECERLHALGPQPGL